MALGGGTFTSQNKVLPGSYINVVSAARANAELGERGTVAMAIGHTWGPRQTVVTITADEFIKNSLNLLGYDYSAPELSQFREVFKHATKVHYIRLNSSSAKADCTYATAKYEGTRGNDLQVVIAKNIDDTSKYDVSLYLGTVEVDKQTVASAAELVENDFVIWKTGASLAVTAGTPLTGGSNGAYQIGNHQTALNKLEAYNFNTLVNNNTDTAIQSLYAEYTKRMRDTLGVKFQLILPLVGSTGHDYEGIVDVAYGTEGIGVIYWVAGALAGCAINKSCTNMKYDGEVTGFKSDWTQVELESNIKKGLFCFHNVEDEIRVLVDINSFVSFTDEKNDLFASNKTIRVIDQLANDDAHEFNTKFLGKVDNDAPGRISFWNNCVTRRREMETMRAIQNYNSDDLKVEQGTKNTSVVVKDSVTITGTMEKLYMTIVIN